MAESKQLNPTQLNQPFEGIDSNCISQHLTVARDVRLDLIKNQIFDQPTLLPEMRILIVKQGCASPIVNMIERRFETGDLIFLATNGILQYPAPAIDLQGISLSISDELFPLATGNRIPKAFDGHLRDFHLHLQNQDLEYLDRLHHLLYQHLRQPDNSAQVTLHLVSAFLWYVDNLWSKQEQSNLKTQSREQRLFTGFIQLVSEYAPQHHTIDFYASQLGITPRYLSSVVKQASGKSAKQWIDEALVTRIKIDLMHTDKPITRISDDMNFPNQSFFTKFFKRTTGMTPKQFRH